MTGSPTNQDILDLRKIRRLVELMNEHDLLELDLQQGQTRIRIRRGGESAAAGGVQPVVAAVPVAPSAPAPAEQSLPTAPEAPPKEDYIVLIKSPMVGTFYSASDPDSPPYAKVGDPVGPESVVCIVEAMKVFNQIPAEVSGKIAGVLVENGEPVEYGQPLFKVDTRK